MRSAWLAGMLGAWLSLCVADAANALTITAAKVTDRGVVHIAGSGAGNGTAIAWQGQLVTHASAGGNFAFAPSRPFLAPPFPGRHAPSPARHPPLEPAGTAGAGGVVGLVVGVTMVQRIPLLVGCYLYAGIPSLYFLTLDAGSLLRWPWQAARAHLALFSTALLWWSMMRQLLLTTP